MKKGWCNLKSETRSSNTFLRGLPIDTEMLNTVFGENKLEYLDIEYTKQEKEKYKAELEKAKKDIDDIKHNYDKYFSKNSVREGELRNHIQSLSQKVHCRDINQIKTSMVSLHGQIIKNISTIDQKMRVEITEKKKDIENRINIRLMDSEYRHKLVLDEKVREQEGMLRSLHSITQEMSRIKENYIKIKKRIDSYTNSIVEYNRKLVIENVRSRKLKITFKHYKILIKDGLNKVNQAEMLESGNKRLGLKSATSNNVTMSLINPKEAFLFPANSLGIIKGDQSERSFKSEQEDSRSEHKPLNWKDPETVAAMVVKISDKYPKTRRTIELLGNTLNVITNKYNKLKKDCDDLIIGKTSIESRVNDVVSDLKSLNESAEVSRVAPATEIYNSIEDRKRFIEMLVNNEELLSIYNDEKFPTVNVACRSVFNPK